MSWSNILMEQLIQLITFKLTETWPGYIGNISWEEVKPYVGDIFVEEAKNFIENITIENQIENTINNSFSSLSEVSPQVTQ